MSDGSALFPLPVVGLAWQRDAACRRAVAAGIVPASLWDDHVDGESRRRRTDRHRTAATYCAACPVADQCLADASYGGGLRGGHVLPDDSDYRTSEPAAEARTRARRTRPDCGTPGGKAAHLRRGEDVDDECEQAARAYHAAKMRASRQRAKARREATLTARLAEASA